MIQISRKHLIWFLGLALLIFLAAAIHGVMRARSMGFLRFPVFETIPPDVPALGRPAILVFSKTNSFIHKEAIPAARRLLETIGAERRWSVYFTDNGAVYNVEDLAKFDLTVWNNVTGDVLTAEQRDAMRAWLEHGGGFVGLHAAGDNSHDAWPWYQDQVIRARFTGHPLDPQFQDATVRIEQPPDPIVAEAPEAWRRRDEWYSFESSPRSGDVQVLATVDESTYSPGSFFGTELDMGDDHPIIWKHCIGSGRVFYSAMGHTGESYGEPEYQAILERAMEWAGQLSGPSPIGECDPMTDTQQDLTQQIAPPMSSEALAADPLFAEPYIDIDEWREGPVPHRYIHGGFTGTETRFSYYFPPAEQYEGRFFQHITPIPDSENLAPKAPPGEFNKIGFSIDSGAYFIETNGGGHLDFSGPGGTRADSTITAFRANAAAARYSRSVAEAIYATDERPYGYAYGGSGGGYRTIGSIENTSGVWDGVLPYVIGSTMAIPNMFSVRMHAMRILKDKFPQIVDAIEPGGSGKPYAGLTEEEAAALREVTRMGFPPESWFGHDSMGVHGFAALYQGVVAADPGYFTDFWTRPGYLGFDDPESFKAYRIQFETTVAEPVTAAEAARLQIYTNPWDDKARGGVDTAFREPTGADGQKIVGFRLVDMPPDVDFLGGDLAVFTGKAAGETFSLARIVDNVVVLGIADAAAVDGLQAGDKVTVDNSNFLAAQTYHRHQVPGPDFPVWDQFRNEDGQPIYPQRPTLIGPLFVQATSGSQMTGQFEGKMIVVASLWDREAMPWQADWYRQRVVEHFGDRVGDHFRLYYTDHALHGDEPTLEDQTRVVSYQGVLQQALRDLSAWVEKGVEAPASTNYDIIDGQVVVPDSAEERQGIQPVVTLSAAGRKRVEVNVGEPVQFTGTITVPPGTGAVTAAEWDFDGSGSFAHGSSVGTGERSVPISISHSFDTPGTYFPVLRGISQRQGDPNALYARIWNLDRVRVVVR